MMTIPLIILIIIWAVMFIEGLTICVLWRRWKLTLGNKGVSIDLILLTISKLQKQVEELRGVK
jgi:hypothetical protein